MQPQPRGVGPPSRCALSQPPPALPPTSGTRACRQCRRRGRLLASAFLLWPLRRYPVPHEEEREKRWATARRSGGEGGEGRCSRSSLQIGSRWSLCRGAQAVWRSRGKWGRIDRRRRERAVEARSLLTGGRGRMRRLELGRAGPGAPRAPVAAASILGLAARRRPGAPHRRKPCPAPRRLALAGRGARIDGIHGRLSPPPLAL
jgi:hypothetical protein